MTQAQEKIDPPPLHETTQHEQEAIVAHDLGALSVKGLEATNESWSNLLIQKTIERLEESGEVGESLIPVYLAAVDESPRVRHTIVDITSARDNPVLEAGPAMHEETETGDILRLADSWSAYRRFLHDYPGGKRAFAERFGRDSETLTEKDVAMLAAAHELGHVEERSFKGEKASSIRREEMDSLPLAGRDPSELARFLKTPKGLMYWYKNKERFAVEGVTSRDTLVARQREAYCRLPSERAADEFAIRVMKRVEEGVKI